MSYYQDKNYHRVSHMSIKSINGSIRTELKHRTLVRYWQVFACKLFLIKKMKPRKYFAAAVIVAASLLSVQCQKEALIDTGDDQLGKIQGSYTWTMAGLGELGRRFYWFTGMPVKTQLTFTFSSKSNN